MTPAAAAALARDEARFFGAIKLSNGMFMTTSEARLTDVDRRLTAHLRQQGLTPRRILDVGAASGRTSVEWHAALEAAGISPEFVASDRTLKAYLVCVAPGLRALVDGEGFPLQYDILGLALRPWSRRLDYVTGYWLVGRLAALVFAGLGLRRRFLRWKQGAPSAGGGLAVREIRLLSAPARRASGIAFVEDDLGTRNPETMIARFDIVRAANVLLLDFFSASELRHMLATIRERLTGPGALLLVCRTLLDGSNHATLFALKADGTFERRARIGKGSEIEDLVLGLPPAASLSPQPG